MIGSVNHGSNLSPDVPYVRHESYDDPSVVRDILESLPAEVVEGGYSPEDEVKLFEHMNCLRHLAAKHTGSQRVQDFLAQANESREKLTLANMGLAISTAQKFKQNVIPLEDLIGDARIALLKAIDHFDCHRGFRFSTYAVTTIQRQLIRKIQKHHRQSRKVHFGDQEVLEQTVAEHRFVEYPFELAAVACASVSTLNESDRQLIESRFGLKQAKPMSLRELGIEHGVSGERIRQRLQSIFQQLRDHLRQNSEIDDWKIAS